MVRATRPLAPSSLDWPSTVTTLLPRTCHFGAHAAEKFGKVFNMWPSLAAFRMIVVPCSARGEKQCIFRRGHGRLRPEILQCLAEDSFVPDRSRNVHFEPRSECPERHAGVPQDRSGADGTSPAMHFACPCQRAVALCSTIDALCGAPRGVPTDDGS